MPDKPRLVACPTCGAPVSWSQSSVWRPFCSKRCKMIDLGAWASERYRVPVQDDPDQPEIARPDDASQQDS